MALMEWTKEGLGTVSLSKGTLPDGEEYYMILLSAPSDVTWKDFSPWVDYIKENLDVKTLVISIGSKIRQAYIDGWFEGLSVTCAQISSFTSNCYISSANSTFKNASNLKEAWLDSGILFDQCTDTRHMFDGCRNLTLVNFGTGIDASYCVDFSDMFRECIFLETLTLGNNWTANVPLPKTMYDYNNVAYQVTPTGISTLYGARPNGTEYFMTSDYSKLADGIMYEPHNYIDCTDDSNAFMLLRDLTTLRKQFAVESNEETRRELGNQIANLLKNNEDIIKSFMIDANVINAISEELRNIEVYITKVDEQKAYYQSSMPSRCKYNDIWIGV